MLPTLYKLLNELRELAALVRTLCLVGGHLDSILKNGILFREIVSWMAKERPLLAVKTLRGCVTKRLRAA